MEEKKVLNMNKEEFCESLNNLDLDSIELPEELLEKVAGGSVFDGTLIGIRIIWTPASLLIKNMALIWKKRYATC